MTTHVGDVAACSFTPYGPTMILLAGTSESTQIDVSKPITLDGKPATWQQIVIALTTDILSLTAICDPEHFNRGNRADFTTIAPIPPIIHDGKWPQPMPKADK